MEWCAQAKGANLIFGTVPFLLLVQFGIERNTEWLSKLIFILHSYAPAEADIQFNDFKNYVWDLMFSSFAGVNN